MALQQSYPVFTGVEVRVRIASDLYRIPDISMWAGAAPDAVPATPPLLVVEISSPDDWLDVMLQKLEEYRLWGVQHIWLIEPELKRIHVYDHGSLREVSRRSCRSSASRRRPASAHRLRCCRALALLDVAVSFLHAEAGRRQPFADFAGDQHAAVVSAGAAERDRQVALAFGDIVRQQVDQQIRDTLDEFGGLREKIEYSAPRSDACR